MLLVKPCMRPDQIAKKQDTISLVSSLPLCLHLPLLRLEQVPKPTPGMETMPTATMEGLVMPTVTATLLLLTTPLQLL